MPQVACWRCIHRHPNAEGAAVQYNMEPWFKKMHSHIERHNLGVRIRAQYGFHDSVDTLHLFVEFDPSSDAAVHHEDTVKEIMLRCLPISKSLVHGVRVVPLPTLHSKLFWLYSLAYLRLKASQTYGAGLDARRGDIGGIHFSSLMAFMGLSHAITVRRAADCEEFLRKKERMDDLDGSSVIPDDYRGDWGHPHRRHSFSSTRPSPLFDDCIGAVRPPAGAWWIYYIAVQLNKGPKATITTLNNFFKSQFIHSARAQLVTSGGTKQCYHLLLTLDTPLTPDEISRRWGAQWKESRAAATMSDFIPVDTAVSLDFITTLFAHEACKPTGMAKDPGLMYPFCRNLLSAFRNACRDPVRSKAQYLGEELFKGRKTPLINGETESILREKDTEFFMAVFHQSARVFGLTDAVTMGDRLHLMAAHPGGHKVTTCLNFSATHDANHPLRVFTNVKPVEKAWLQLQPPEPLPTSSPRPSPASSRGSSRQQDDELWMSAFTESPKHTAGQTQGGENGGPPKSSSSGAQVQHIAVTAIARITAPRDPPAEPILPVAKARAVVELTGEIKALPTIYAVLQGPTMNRFLQVVDCIPEEQPVQPGTHPDAHTCELLRQMIQAEQAIGRAMDAEHGPVFPTSVPRELSGSDSNANAGTKMRISNIVNTEVASDTVEGKSTLVHEARQQSAAIMDVSNLTGDTMKSKNTGRPLGCGSDVPITSDTFKSSVDKLAEALETRDHDACAQFKGGTYHPIACTNLSPDLTITRRLRADSAGMKRATLQRALSMAEGCVRLHGVTLLRMHEELPRPRMETGAPLPDLRPYNRLLQAAEDAHRAAKQARKAAEELYKLNEAKRPRTGDA